jgi:gluconate 2-dehydrogenase gamma chain
MPDEKDNISRRDALKTITVGAGVIAALPVLGSVARADDDTGHEHMHHAMGAGQEADAGPYKLQFFTDAENKTVIEMTERIIPADDHSPGAKAARVSEFIDLIVSQSPEGTKQNWRDGLAAIDKMSQKMFGKNFADASVEQQVALLKEISKNEMSPKTTEERFFRTVKNSTIDGYYTSKIGIHEELHYKGNTYLKEFVGCTHPEHQGK